MNKRRRIHPAAVAKKLTVHPLVTWLGVTVLVLVFYALLYKLLLPKINGFGCFDECVNYGGGFFMTYGKQLYSQIYFDHQPMMAFLSFFIQLITKPQNLTELLLRHYQFLFLFSISFALLLIYRFRIAAVVFLVLYELTKYYLFGTRFLGESFLIYPLVFLVGIALDKLRGQQLSTLDYLLSGIFAWFILFTREPYSLGVLLLLGSVIFPLRQTAQRLAFGIFIGLSFGLLLFLPNHWLHGLV